MKKLVSLFLALALLLSVMSFASAEEDMTINVMLPDFYSDSDFVSLEDGNPVLQKIYEATGVKLNITWVPDSGYGERTTLTLADRNNMPEVMVMQGVRDAIMISSARVPTRSTTLLIMWLSSLSMTPSSSETLTSVRSSVSVITGRASGSTPRSRSSMREMLSTTKITGVRTVMSTRITPASRRAILSAFAEAMFFGVISPKMRTRSVSTPETIPTEELPNRLIARTVVREVAAILTMLFPIRIVDSIFARRSVM